LYNGVEEKSYKFTLLRSTEFLQLTKIAPVFYSDAWRLLNSSCQQVESM